MNFAEAFRIALASIAGSKLRSALTLLGVVIGVMTIIATMAVLRGLDRLMEDEMSSLTTGVFQVERFEPRVGIHVGGRRREYRPDLGQREYNAIVEHVPLARIVSPIVSTWAGTIKFKGEATNPNVDIIGGGPGAELNNGYTIARGRSLTAQDVQYARSITVIGDAIARRLFPFRDPVGETVTINGHRARVVGLLQEKGSMLNGNADRLVAVPISTFERWFGNERSWSISVQVTDPARMDEAIQQTTTAVRIARGLRPGEENNFAIWHSNELLESFNNMTRWIGIAAFGIAAISLLVAGIGIMNIMLVSVTERTREIGVRKAIGAKRSGILGQFLVEAVILTWIGGLLGVLVGVGGAYLVGAAADLPVAVPVWSIAVGLVFCTAIGLGFGTWPAWKASRLDPIEALRYE